jgi:MFS family permease
MMAVAALILGIASLAIPYGGPVLGILAIVFAVLGRKKQPEKKGMATAGLVMGIIGVVWGVILVVIIVTCCGAVAAFGNEMGRALEEGGFEALEELEE